MKNLKRIIKKQTGITLIALIITVVILIIVAGISISQISGDGLVSRTLSAREQAEIQGEKETIQAAVVNAKGRNRYGKLTKNELQEELGSDYTLSEEENMYIINITQTKRSYLLDKKGNISERGKWGVDYTTGRISINGEEVKSGNVYLEIGDTIAGYDPTDGASINEVTSYGESTTAHPSANGYADTVFRLVGAQEDDEETEEDETLVSYDLSNGWKLLGVTTTGNLMITTADVVYPVSVGETTTGTLNYHLYGRLGYQNATEELDKICNLYGQGHMATSARSIKVEDINKVTGYNPEDVDGNGNPYKVGQIEEYGNKVTYYWQGTEYPYYETSNELNGTYNYAHYNFFWWDGEKWNTQAKSNTATDGKKEKITELTNTYYTYTKASIRRQYKSK